MDVSGPILRLGPLDLVIVGLFVAAILALGFSAKVRNLSVLQFLAAGRALTLPAFVATLVSTWYGGILGIGESVSYYGFGAWLLLGVPYYVFALLYARFLATRVREAEQISLPERLASRWGKGVGLAGAGLIFLLAVPAAHVLMLGTLVEAFSGWSLGLSVVVATAAGAVFLIRGGLLADVRVSILAFVMMYVGFGTMLIYCLLNHPPGEALAQIQEPKLKTVTGGTGPIEILTFFVLGAWTLVDPGFHQRVASCETPETGRKGVLVSTGFWMLFDILSIGTAMYALALLKSPPEQPLLIFPAFAQEILPDGLKAVFVCGMLGTILSAMVGYALVSGATIGREVVGRVKPGLDDERIKLWTRIGIGIACLAAIALAMQVKSVVSLWYAWAGAVVGALLIPVAMAYGRRSRMSPGWVLAALLLAFAGAATWMAYSLRVGNAFYEVVWAQGRVWVPPLPPSVEGDAGTLRIGVGTLVPGLVISTIVLALGTVLSRGEKKHG